MLYRIKMRFGSVTQDTSLLTPTRAGKTFRLLTTAKSYVYNVFRLAYDKNRRGENENEEYYNHLASTFSRAIWCFRNNSCHFLLSLSLSLFFRFFGVRDNAS